MHRILAALALSAGLARAADKDALTAAHTPRQAAVAEAVKALRPWAMQGVQPDAPITLLAKPLDTLADAADLIARDSPPADNITAGAVFENGIRAKFRRYGWPTPASLGDGFRWLQGQFERLTPQTQRAVVTTA